MPGLIWQTLAKPDGAGRVFPLLRHDALIAGVRRGPDGAR